MGFKSIGYVKEPVFISEESLNYAKHTFLGDQFWDMESIAFFYKISKGAKHLILDIGAQIGCFTLLSKELALPILAIEANPEAIHHLRENLELNLNPEQLKKVEILNVAVSDNQGKLRLKINNNHTGLSNLGYRQLRMIPNRELEVTSICLDSLNLDKVSVVKMDIEGGEYDAIQGGKEMLSRHKPILFIERFPENLAQFGRTISELDALLDSLGYKLRFVIGDNALFSYRWNFRIVRVIILYKLSGLIKNTLSNR